MDNLFFMEIKCRNTKDAFYARFDLAADDVWALTYGLKDMPAGDGAGSSKSTDFNMSNLRIGPQYCCPYCADRGTRVANFVKCGNCGKLTCYDDSGTFTCAYCGNKGRVEGTIDKLKSDRRGSGQ